MTQTSTRTVEARESSASIPVWASESPLRWRPPLSGDTFADVCLIGAGMSGLATAYQLARDGLKVLVLDDGPIGGGETIRTSAHLSSAVDDGFHRIESVHNARAAQLCYQSHAAAIDWIEETIQREGIACAFERVNGYLFLPVGGREDILTTEFDAALRAGAQVTWVDHSALPDYDTGPCLCFANQASFNPIGYLIGLAQAVERLGGRIYCGSHVRKIEDDNGLCVTCENGAVVRAASVVVATNSPVNDIVTMHTKQHAYRTYAIALPVEPGSVPKALYWDTSQEAVDPDGPYHYVRLSGGAPDSELLIVGGEDHRTGQDTDYAARWVRLQLWAQARFRVSGKIAYQWSGQVMEPVDHVAFIGENPTGPTGTYIVTGDSGMGLTHAAIAAMLLSDLIANRTNEWASLYDPARRNLQTAWNYAKENLNTATQYTDWLRAGERASADEITPDSGAVLRNGLKLLACYRGENGDLHTCSATCPHLGGVVRWNPAEKTWDCPCHGSRFTRYGEVINGPALSSLTPADNSNGHGVRRTPTV